MTLKEKAKSGLGKAWCYLKEEGGSAKSLAEKGVKKVASYGPTVRREATRTARGTQRYSNRVRRNVSSSESMSAFLGVPHREGEKGHKQGRRTTIVVQFQGSNGGKVKKKRKRGSQSSNLLFY